MALNHARPIGHGHALYARASAGRLGAIMNAHAGLANDDMLLSYDARYHRMEVSHVRIENAIGRDRDRVGNAIARDGASGRCRFGHVSFNSKNSIMAGGLYGITAVDEQPQTFGKRTSVAVAAGQRTIWYACPFGPRSKLTQDFTAGAKYELVCRPGQLAEIKRIDEC